MTINTTLQLKTSSVANKTPQTSDLALGELAINTANGIVFMEDTVGNIRKFSANTVSTSASATLRAITTSNGYLMHDSAIDANGNIYSCGYYTNTTQKIVISKTSASGTLLWSRELGGGVSTANQGYSIAIDSNNNPIVAGFYTNASSQLVGIVAKYSTTGILQWQRTTTSSTTTTTQFLGVSVDSDSNIYVCGISYHDSAPAGYGGVIVKYNTQGASVTQKVWNAATSPWGSEFYDIVVDKVNKCVYAVGYTQISSTNYNNILVKFDLSLNVLWQKVINTNVTAAQVAAQAITVDYQGNPILTTTSSASAVVLLMKHDTAGNLLWQRTLTYSGSTYIIAQALVIDANNSIYLGGYTSASYSSVASYNSSGSIQWQAKLTGAYISSAIIDSVGNLIVNTYTGYFWYNSIVSLPVTVPGSSFVWSAGTGTDAAGSFTSTTATGSLYSFTNTEAAGALVDASTLAVSLTIYQ